MPKHGKNYKESSSKIESTKRYEFNEAIDAAISSAYAKFDETVDVAVRLGVDPRHADQMVRGTVVLPNGLGKEVKVLVFAKGEKEMEAREAGAEFVGNEWVEKIQIKFEIIGDSSPDAGKALWSNVKKYPDEVCIKGKLYEITVRRSVPKKE